MARRVFNLAKAIAQGYAWTQSGQKVVIENIAIGYTKYPIKGIIVWKELDVNERQCWTLTGRFLCSSRDELDLTTIKP